MSGAVISILAAIAMLCLAGFSLYRDRSRAGLALGAALIVTALLELCDMKALRPGTEAIFWKRSAVVAESLLPALWILCSLTFARQAGPWKIGRLMQAGIAATFLFVALPCILPLDAFFYAPDFPAERVLFLGNTGYFYYLGIMICLVFALFHFEATLANASPEALWKIKFDIIGLGTMLAVLVFYYSQALIYRTLNMGYVPLRAFIYLVSVALMLYSLLFRGRNVRIQVSRQAAFKSVVLIAVGIYLIMLGLMGEGMQYFQTSFPRTVTISFAFLAGIALLLLLLSQRVRREVKVVLHKNFYQHKHDYRTQWLRFSEQLASSRSGEELLQRTLAAYCEVFGISGAALFMYEEGRGGYCAVAEYELQPYPEVIARDNSLISYIRERGWVFCSRDDNPLVLEENNDFFSRCNVSFVIPLNSGECLEGFIVLGRVIKENETYIYEDYDLMKTIARQASLAIMHHKLSEQITQAREMQAIGNVATFVAHDLKNLVSNLSLIVQNAGKHIHNPDFQKDMLTSLGNTVEKMQLLIGSLKNLGERELYTLQPVNLRELAEKTVRTIGSPSVVVSGPEVMARVDVNEIQKVVLNLVINAIEASEPGQPVLVETGEDGSPFIRIKDSGCGMSPRFVRTELFKPFRTTKNQGLGIGLYQCRQIIEAHEGRIEVNSMEGSGSEFTIQFARIDGSAAHVHPEALTS